MNQCVLAEIRDMFQCVACYCSYYTVNAGIESFSMPCGRRKQVHGLAYAKYQRRYWPCKVFKFRDDNNFVIDEEYIDMKIFGRNFST